MNTASKLGAADDQKGGKSSAAKLISGGKKPVSGQTKPWIQFTGPAKKDPIFCSWMIVRQVLSGDTFRLATIKPPKQSLAPSKGVRAPRIGRGDKHEEVSNSMCLLFLAQVSAGTPVLCVAWATIKEESDQHFCGDIYIASKSKNSNEPNAQRESLSNLLVSSGYADLNLKDKNLSPVEQERLSKALEKAKKSGLGKFVDGGGKHQEHVRKVVIVRTPEERKKIADKYTNKTIPAVVDQVWGGSTLRLELIPDGKNLTHEVVVVNLAGCTAPRSQAPQNEDDTDKGNKGKGGGNRKNAPRWSSEAKEFTEERLLSQRVTVKIVATDANSNLYAIVSHPKGQIALSLLRAGLAEYESWTAQLLNNKDQKEMKEALKSAQDKRINIWQDKSTNISHDFVTVTVTQVFSGDSFLAKLPGDVEERFTLSSIRQPRVKESNKEKDNANAKDASAQNTNTNTNAKGKGKDETAQAQHVEHPWARASKEYLRKKLIGKKVQLMCDYEREWKSNAKGGSKVQKICHCFG
ncbi:tudor / nuclease domain-containing protein [Reticulomyxa filosa]|uniref:Tudor / nuclease domain-containing protein n=1 Tax=Reticulomyxa filosa TaxID=46433 RepID=X6NG18_RETFI|nr:tudor / nuclease domain-containing protein [Reticulomyxa filosa]|eukprot:ETO25275.1 tudor / nuclease domain-containing protein [Reticulomyxa filosa]